MWGSSDRSAVKPTWEPQKSSPPPTSGCPQAEENKDKRRITKNSLAVGIGGGDKFLAASYRQEVQEQARLFSFLVFIVSACAFFACCVCLLLSLSYYCLQEHAQLTPRRALSETRPLYLGVPLVESVVLLLLLLLLSSLLWFVLQSSRSLLLLLLFQYCYDFRTAEQEGIPRRSP